MTVETALEVSNQTQVESAQPGVPVHTVAARNGKPVRIDPDLDFIRSLSLRSGNTLKKCFQCGTCSAT